MKIENATIDDLQVGDRVTIVYEGTIEYKAKLDDSFVLKECKGWHYASSWQSLTIHRESELEKLDREIAELQAKRAALVGEVKADKWLPPKQEGFGDWIEFNGNECPVDNDIIVMVVTTYFRNEKQVSGADKAIYFNWQRRTLYPIVAYCVKEG